MWTFNWSQFLLLVTIVRNSWADIFNEEIDQDFNSRKTRQSLSPQLELSVQKFSKKLDQLGIYTKNWCICEDDHKASMCLITCVSCGLHCPNHNPTCLKTCLDCAPRCYGSQACITSCLCDQKCGEAAGDCQDKCLKTGAYPFGKKNVNYKMQEMKNKKNKVNEEESTDVVDDGGMNDEGKNMTPQKGESLLSTKEGRGGPIKKTNKKIKEKTKKIKGRPTTAPDNEISGKLGDGPAKDAEENTDTKEITAGLE